jgi:hypothetical protein
MKTLEIDDFDFDPCSMELNDQGRYLAIAGQHKVIVAVTPMSRSGSSTMNCESFVLGSKYYHHDKYNKIVKILWHPLSATHSHLLVLSSNGILRMFNVIQNVEEPEQTYYFCSMDEDIKKKKSGFGANLDELEATSFCLGPYTGVGSGWSALTVCGLLKSGDVVTLCPVVPNQSTLPYAWAQRTLELTLSEWKETKDRLKSSQFYWTQKWLEEVLSQESNGLQVNRPLRHLPLARSGPCLFQPNPEFLDSMNGIAHDIQMIPTITNPILCIALNNSTLVTGVFLDTPMPHWVVEKVH